MSNNKVASMKQCTIPCLELQGAVMSAKVDALLRKELSICRGPRPHPASQQQTPVNSQKRPHKALIEPDPDREEPGAVEESEEEVAKR